MNNLFRSSYQTRIIINTKRGQKTIVDNTISSTQVVDITKEGIEPPERPTRRARVGTGPLREYNTIIDNI